MKQLRHYLLLAAVFALVIAGCKKTDTVTGPGGTTPAQASGTYTGLVTNGTQSGTISINVNGASSRATDRAYSRFAVATVDSASGTYTSGGNTIDLSGTYDTGTDSLHLRGSGGGHNYSFDGTYSGGNIQGNYSVDGENSGSFTTQSSNGGGPVVVYLGTFSYSDSVKGTFCMVVKDSNITGFVYPNFVDYKFPFSGSVAGDSIHVTTPPLIGIGGNVQVAVGAFTDPTDTSATGTYSLPSPVSLSGTWQCAKRN
jgi:hypothetical protein